MGGGFGIPSYDYVKTGIVDGAENGVKYKINCRYSIYTRLWLETPKTEQELAEEEGTEAADYPNKVTSSALGMDEAVDTLNLCRRPGGMG